MLGLNWPSSEGRERSRRRRSGIPGMLCPKRLICSTWFLPSLSLVRYKNERRIPGHDGYLNLVIFSFSLDLHRPFGHACRKIWCQLGQYVTYITWRCRVKASSQEIIKWDQISMIEYTKVSQTEYFYSVIMSFSVGGISTSPCIVGEGWCDT
jgi:hypothetical protein